MSFRINPLDTLLFNVLARTTSQRNRIPYRWFWQRLYNRTRQWQKTVATTIHNRPVVVNFAYSYPIFSRMFPELNNPLVELVKRTFDACCRPIRMVDAGAAIGDTVLLVDANCPKMVAEFICIDGDAEFFGYLEHNLGPLSNCRRILTQLARERREERSLVRIHGGTASSQGSEFVAARPLDDVLAHESIGPIDVLKIDVDGFDGEVLIGGRRTLREQRPAVIFEWHPIMCHQTGNSAQLHFETLATCGYDRAIWFTKYGRFSHFSRVNDHASTAALERYCRSTTTEPDLHFDVIALPSDSTIDAVGLAKLSYARHRRSPA